ncbi:cytochrome P450 [Flagelloscypha sp. PMI_526]|nr:cytochrome P450 [Flagelloscypha sp. PMI_526]
MAKLPPGPRFLLGALPAILLPFALVFGYKNLHPLLFGEEIQKFHLKWAYRLCFPTFYTLVINWKDWKLTWDAYRVGGVLPPRSRHWSPGKIWLLLKFAFQGDNGYLGEPLEINCDKFGHIWNARVLFQDRFVVAEPEYIKYILATRFENHVKGHPIRTAVSSLLGVGVFASDGEMWKFHRQLTRPFFARDRISDFDTFERHATEALARLTTRLREGHAIDFQDLAGRFTLDSATEFLFARDLQTLSAGLPYPHNVPFVRTKSTADVFIDAFNDAQIMTARRMRFADGWPLFEFWGDRVEKRMGVIHDYLNPVIQEAFARKQRKELAGDEDKGLGESETLIDYLVERTDDPIIIRDEVLNILIAGRDTTASTLTVAIYMLAQHPHVLERLRSEILEKLGTSRRPTFDVFRDMKYLRAVLNETLRLYPVVPFNLKTTIDAQLWPNMQDPHAKPWYIPAGAQLPQIFTVLHRRKDLWGPDALDFDPDRFIDDRLKKYLIPNPFIFVPFNAGPRICLGQQFAYHEASYFLVRLLQNFSSISLAPDSQPPASRAPEDWKTEKVGRKSREKVKMMSHLTLMMEGGLWVKMKEAGEGTQL